MRILVTSFLLTIVQLSLAQVAANDKDISPLMISESIPSVQVSNVAGEPLDLVDHVKGQKSIIIFYRGGWCPYCNAHLSELQRIESKFEALGYKVIALSPDSPEELQKTDEEYKLDYTVLSDASTKAMQAFGIAFKGPEKYKDLFIRASGSINSEGTLPVPSVFITDEEGKITFTYVSPDYSHRIQADLLLAVLEAL